MAEERKGLKVGIDAREAEQGANVFARAVEKMRHATKAAEKDVDKLSKGQKAFRSASHEAGDAMQAMAGRLGIMGRAASAAGGAVAGAAVAFAGVGALLISGARELEQYQLSLRKVEAVHKATGGTVGITTRELAKFADEVESATGVAEEKILDASAALMTFRKIQGETFKDTIKAATDLAAVMGTDVQTAAFQLGKAMESPTEGMAMLRRQGVILTPQQEALVRAFEKTGQSLKAADVILKAVNASMGGAANAQNQGLTKATRDLGNAWSDFLKIIGDTPPVRGAIVVLDFLAQKIKALNDLIKEAKEESADVAAARGENGRGASGSWGGSSGAWGPKPGQSPEEIEHGENVVKARDIINGVSSRQKKIGELRDQITFLERVAAGERAAGKATDEYRQAIAALRQQIAELGDPVAKYLKDLERENELLGKNAREAARIKAVWGADEAARQDGRKGASPEEKARAIAAADAAFLDGVRQDNERALSTQLDRERAHERGLQMEAADRSAALGALRSGGTKGYEEELRFMELRNRHLAVYGTLNDEAAADLRALAKEQAAYERSVNETMEAERDWRAMQRDLGSVLSQSFEQAIKSAENLSDVLDGLASQVHDIILRTMFTKPLENEITGLLTGQDVTNGFAASGANFTSMLTKAGSWISSFFGPSMHNGGEVGVHGTARLMSPAMFAGAPRYHAGGIAGLKPDEVPAILQKGERVIPKGGRARSGSVTINVHAPDAGSFRRSEEQIGAMGARMVRRAGRNL